ncbi:daptide biosynthesis RiPP recognition protein [Streptomyces sp. NPDC092296]|uniref:daptide biosynthesis RiPP recognition protein n=1 Tax=Streptomyces sp. NPDC092296 TaxID=3366012 RepID=UPI00382F6A9E
MTMLDAGATPELMSNAALRLQRWVSGCYPSRSETALDVVAEPGADLTALFASGLVTEDTWIYADPESAAAFPTAATVVPTEGSFRYSGDEIVLADEVFIQVFDYSSIGFLTVAGPTVVRITNDDDLAAFLDDADRAAAEGAFPEQLVHPSVQLADLPALAGSTFESGVARLYVAEDGTLRTGPAGVVLPGGGREPQSGGVLDGALTPGLLAQAHRERPWLARYVRVLDALRRLSARHPHGSVQVSGFGFRLCPGLAPAVVEDTDATLLVVVAGQPYLLVGDELKMYRVGREAAVVYEAYQAVEPEQAARLAAEALGLDTEVVRGLYAQLSARIIEPAGGAK